MKTNYLFSLFVIFCCLLCSCNRQLFYVPIEISNNIPLIKVTMDNTEQWMLLDTGSQISILDSSQFRKTSINNKCIVYTVSGKDSIYISDTLYRIKMESFIVDEKLFVKDITELKSIIKNYTNKKIVGIIGSDILIKYDAKIDYEKRKLLLHK